MIRRIGVICQDAISRGFLVGLRDRLGCDAQLVDGPPIGREPYLTRTGAHQAWAFFQRQNVDLIVRFTDSDNNRWQDVKRHELKILPAQAASLLVCGVADRNVEHWLSLDLHHFAQFFGLRPDEIASDEHHRTSKIKDGIYAQRRPDEQVTDTAARFVRELPPHVFKAWLRDESLSTFYDDCRTAALQRDCQVSNDRDA